MGEKRGYPNPNYSDQDIGMEQLEVNAQICIDDKEYRELCQKAAVLDILTADLKAKIDYGCSDYNMIDDSLVLAVTGMGAYKRRKEFEKKGKVEDD